MFERFTDRARQALVVAQNEARSLGHRFIRPEHLLLGLSKVEGLASTAMQRAGVDSEGLRDRVASAFSSNLEARKADKVPFSPESKKSLEMALREALRLGHNYIGTEHLLLGVLHQADTEGSRVGEVLGVEAGRVRARVRALLSSTTDGVHALSPALTEAMGKAEDRAEGAPLTTGHLLEAMLADPSSQVSRALDTLGVAPQAIGHALADVPISATSDTVATPHLLELKLGERSLTIDDRDVVAELQSLTAEQLRVVLRQAFGLDDEPGATAARR